MEFGSMSREDLGLVCDLYELTMAQVYFDRGMHEESTYEFFVRPDPRRSFYLFAGLEQLLSFLQSVRFGEDAIEYLQSTGKFSGPFLDYLKDFRFRGRVRAFEEGEIFFANEPVVSIEASLIEAQIVETALINILQHAILVATKAARCVIAARGTKLVDFGFRRAHGFDAAAKAARSAYVAGFLGTSNVHAGKMFGIPIFGTMAHSFVLAHESEEEAFDDFVEHYPDNAVLLVDTFDTIEGIKKAIEVSKKKKRPLKGIRIDSGDIVVLSKVARELLDRAGYEDTMILVSGGLNEYLIEKYLEQGAAVDAWGVGTELVVSADMPYLDCAYKLVEYGGRPKMKRSSGKVTLPGRKRVWRKDFVDEVCLYEEACEGEEMLRVVMERGVVTSELPSLQGIRRKAMERLAKLPSHLKNLHSRTAYEAKISRKLHRLMLTLA